MADVWKWGAKVGGNLWRTTGDISDHWQTMDEDRLQPIRYRFLHAGRATGTIPTCWRSATAA